MTLTVYNLDLYAPEEVLKNLKNIPTLLHNQESPDKILIINNNEIHNRALDFVVYEPIYLMGTRSSEYIHMQKKKADHIREIDKSINDLSDRVPYNIRKPLELRYSDETMPEQFNEDGTLKTAELLEFPINDEYDFTKGALFAGYVKSFYSDQRGCSFTQKDDITGTSVTLKGDLYKINYLVVYPKSNGGRKKKLKQTFKHKRNKKSKKNRSKKNRSKKNKSKKGGRQSN